MAMVKLFEINNKRVVVADTRNDALEMAQRFYGDKGRVIDEVQASDGVNLLARFVFMEQDVLLETIEILKDQPYVRLLAIEALHIQTVTQIDRELLLVPHDVLMGAVIKGGLLDD